MTLELNLYGKSPVANVKPIYDTSKITDAEYKQQADIVNRVLYGASASTDTRITGEVIKVLAKEDPETLTNLMALISKNGSDGIDLTDAEKLDLKKTISGVVVTHGNPPADLNNKMAESIRSKVAAFMTARNNGQQGVSSNDLFDVSKADGTVEGQVADGKITLDEFLKAGILWGKQIPTEMKAFTIADDIDEVYKKTAVWTDAYGGNTSQMLEDIALIGPLLGVLPNEAKDWDSNQIQQAKETLAEIRNLSQEVSFSWFSKKDDHNEAKLQDLLAQKGIRGFSCAGIRAFAERIHEKVSKGEIKNIYGAMSYSINTGLVNDGDPSTSSLADIKADKYTYADIFSKFASELSNPKAEYSFVSSDDLKVPFAGDKATIVQKMQETNKGLLDEIKQKLDPKDKNDVDKIFNELMRALFEAEVFTPEEKQKLFDKEDFFDKATNSFKGLFSYSSLASMDKNLPVLFNRIAKGEMKSLKDAEKMKSVWESIKTRDEHGIDYKDQYSDPVKNKEKIANQKIVLSGLPNIQMNVGALNNSSPSLRIVASEILKKYSADAKFKNRVNTNLGISTDINSDKMLLDMLYDKVSGNESISGPEDINRISGKVAALLDTIVSEKQMTSEEFDSKVKGITDNADPRIAASAQQMATPPQDPSPSAAQLAAAQKMMGGAYQ